MILNVNGNYTPEELKDMTDEQIQELYQKEQGLIIDKTKEVNT